MQYMLYSSSLYRQITYVEIRIKQVKFIYKDDLNGMAEWHLLTVEWKAKLKIGKANKGGGFECKQSPFCRHSRTVRQSYYRNLYIRSAV
jgi:hypothetical protein